MPTRLTPDQEEVLRWLVEEYEAGKLSGHFSPIWTLQERIPAMLLDAKGERSVPPSSLPFFQGTCEALAAAGMLVRQGAGTRDERFSLTGDALATVHRNFAPEIPPPRTVNYDQRHQTISGTQYNAAGDIVINTVHNQLEFVQHLEKIREEIERAAADNIIDADVAIDTDAQIRKAIVESKKERPDKKKISEHFGKAKGLLGDAAAAAGLVKLLLDAGEVAHRLFG